MKKTKLPIAFGLICFSCCWGQSVELAVSLDSSNLNFTWVGEAEVVYRLTSSSDLSSPASEWDVVLDEVMSEITTGEFSIPYPDDEARFYRLEEALEPMLEIDMVTVGDVGNPPDPNGVTLFGNNGNVNYEYQISKFEITNSDYVTFLNAVDPEGLNELFLYSKLMGISASNGGIILNVSNDLGTKYELKDGFANRPVVYVDFYDAMRFCNWLHNGAQIGSDTEYGAYTIAGVALPGNSAQITRNSGAKFTIPTNNEWYKAAYYQPAIDGGDVDSYWKYPTRSNVEPSQLLPPGNSTSANYDDFFGGNSVVGSFVNSVGYYGTFDMAGNVAEWVETFKFSDDLTILRTIRGGSWQSSGIILTAGSPSFSSPSGDLHNRGFRITAH